MMITSLVNSFVSSSWLFKVSFTLFSSYLIIKIIEKLLKISKLPPGPYGLPIIGYLPFIGNDFVSTFTQLGNKYGPVYSLNMFKYDYIVINDLKHIKEALSKDELLARPPEGLFGGFWPEKGIVDSSGNIWKEQRRTALHLLRDVGLMKTEMENAIREEMVFLRKELDKNLNKPYPDLLMLLKSSISNNVCFLVYGRRFDYHEKDKIKLDRLFDTLNEGLNFFGIIAVMPFLVYVFNFFGVKRYQNFLEARDWSLKFNDKQIANHKNPDYEHCPDFIDKFVEKINELSKPHPPFDMPTLRRNLIIFFAAGSATIFSTLKWGLVLLLKHPEYQVKIRQELMQNIGSREATYEDRNLTPLLQAFIFEVLRYRTIIPINLMRFVSKQCKVGDYILPEGCPVLMNFYNVDHDPALWTDPEKFYPERFISDDGKLNIPSHFFPFGAGKRNCIGEGMAKVELYHYFSTLIQNYSIESVDGPEKVSDEAKFGFGIVPKTIPQIIFKKIN